MSNQSAWRRNKAAWKAIEDKITRLESDRAKLVAMLKKANAILGGLLNQCSAQEVRESFGREKKGADEIIALLRELGELK